MRSVPLVLLLAATSACAARGDTRFPSLAVRPGERVSGNLEAAPPPVPPRATAATGERLARLRAAALAAHRRFAEQRGRATRLAVAARGAAVASEAWSVAQIGLAELDSARSTAMIALADIDALYVAAAEGAAATGGSGDLEAVAAARAEVSGWIAEEDAALAALRGGIAG